MSSFLSQYGSQILTLTFEHLWLTGGAMLFATAIAVPAGIWLTAATGRQLPLSGSSVAEPPAPPGSWRFLTTSSRPRDLVRWPTAPERATSESTISLGSPVSTSTDTSGALRRNMRAMSAPVPSGRW